MCLTLAIKAQKNLVGPKKPHRNQKTRERKKERERRKEKERKIR